MFKRVICLWTMLIMTFSHFVLVGCKNKHGFEIGYNYVQVEERGPFIEVAARSERTKFNIDDVTIEFSFGWFDYELDDYKREKFVLYFFNSLDNNYVISQLSPYDLSNNIDKAEFIREILASEFLTEKYKFTTSWRNGKKFAHSEMITIPSNLFLNYIPDGRGEIVFILADIIDIDGVYSPISIPRVRLKYQFINENIVKIIGPYWFSPNSRVLGC